MTRTGGDDASERSLARVLWTRRHAVIAGIALVGIAAHLVLRFGAAMPEPGRSIPLVVVMALGGAPLVIELLIGLFRRRFGSDLLAGISMVTAVILGEYLAGALVVLMLSGGETLESFAVQRASSVLRALAARMPLVAHRRDPAGGVVDVPVGQVAVGDEVVVFPHEIGPVDGEVIEGHGWMDESFLTGEPFRISKAPGTAVLSGAINGEAALTIRATKAAVDSRYARIMEVMRSSERDAPRMRRLGDQLGALYTPLAVAVAILAWVFSRDPERFLAVLVVATPCPLIIAIPVAIIGSVSLAARRGIIIKKPIVLEQVDTCRTLIFDKTGTLTYGEPRLSECIVPAGVAKEHVLALTASLERYSKHPLASAVLSAADAMNLTLLEATHVSEPPGQGLRGEVAGHEVRVTSRRVAAAADPARASQMPPVGGGLECAVLIDGVYSGLLRFRDEPRKGGRPFIEHLGPRHRFTKLMLVSGDRESEVRYLAEEVGIAEVHAGQSPEEKVAIVRRETSKAPTLFLGDGINDAPAIAAATVGVAMGHASDITTEAAGAVIMESSLEKVDEFLHIGRRMRSIGLQSAVGGIALSVGGMAFAAAGLLPPVGGAVFQEIIDVFAVLNALRAAVPPRALTDYSVPDR